MKPNENTTVTQQKRLRESPQEVQRYQSDKGLCIYV